MKALFCLYSIVLYPLFLYAQADTAQARFYIWEDGRYGCIDVRGNVVIPPQYYNVDEFSEGLAAVRAPGGYGFINTDGCMMIAPQFEYAESFYEGFAKVYADGKPYFINREGKKAFTFDYAQASNFDNGRAIVSTASGRAGNSYYTCLAKVGNM